MKKDTKKDLAHNAREIKKTGGGKSSLRDVEDTELFNLVPEQIIGLSNRFDSDSVVEKCQNEGAATTIVLDQDDTKNDEINDIITHVAGGSERPSIRLNMNATPKTSQAVVKTFVKPYLRTPKTDKAAELAELRKLKLEWEIIDSSNQERRIKSNLATSANWASGWRSNRHNHLRRTNHGNFVKSISNISFNLNKLLLQSIS